MTTQLQPHIVLVQGPNMNLLGVREPRKYGTTTYEEVIELCRETAERRGARLTAFQSNSEGALIDFLQSQLGACDGIVVNPAALSHESGALLDLFRCFSVPLIEVHVTNVFREVPPPLMLTATATKGVIAGLGAAGYVLAVEYLLESHAETRSTSAQNPG